MEAARDTFNAEIANGERYRFGRNWARFVELLTEERIVQAEQSLAALLGRPRLDGLTFLDIGSGSGLFSLAARRLGAKVTSFDFDPDSVNCATGLRSRFFPDDANWTVMRGSVLDPTFMSSLGQHDIVYSWGVLHHTGQMYEAIERAAERVKNSGLFAIALYRETWLCPLWKIEKRAYVSSPPWVQRLLRDSYKATIGLAYRATHRGVKAPRGMDEDVDVHDWLGGYPYESITPRKLKEFLGARGMVLVRQNTKSEGVHLTPGCDEFVLRKSAS